MTTVFDAILAGTIPCHRILETDEVLAFLDIAPLAPGHTLVIPKARVAFLHELSEASAAALGAALPKICAAVCAATGTTDYNVLQNNGKAAHQAVMHVHFHVIPRPKSGGGLGLAWQPGSLTTDTGEALAAKIRTALNAA